MKMCHVCAASCPDDAELCPNCGAELLPEEEEKSEVACEEAVINNPTFAVSIDDPVTAEIFEDVLKDARIPYAVNGGNEMRVGFGGGLMAVDFYVDENDVDRAKELFDELDNQTFEE